MIAKLEMSGANIASATIPTKPPNTDITVVRPMASPASPRFAIG